MDKIVSAAPDRLEVEERNKREIAGQLAALQAQCRRIDLRGNMSVEEYQAAVLSYWTPKRRAAAKPLPMPRLAPDRGEAGTSSAPRLFDDQPLFHISGRPDAETLAVIEGKARPPAAAPAFTSTKIAAGDMHTSPYAMMARLYVTFYGQPDYCSAFLVDEFSVVTAAHAVFNFDPDHPGTGEYGANFMVEVQYCDGSKAASYAVDAFYLPTDWLDKQDTSADFAVLHLAEPALWGHFDLIYTKTDWSNAPIVSLGYPQIATAKYPYDGKFLWSCSTSAQNTNKQGIVAIGSDFTHGASGGPWIIPKTRSAVSLNSYKTGDPNYQFGPIFDSRLYALVSASMRANAGWYLCLPDCGQNPVSVLSAGDKLYAGCNGYVFELVGSEAYIIARNDLKGYGRHDIRLAAGLGYLFVGMNGYLFALPQDDISRIAWVGEMKGAGYGPTHVCCDGNYVFAACNGKIFRYDAHGNSVMNDLTDIGSGEIEIGLGDGYLAFGLNGQVGGYPADVGFVRQDPLWVNPIRTAKGPVSLAANDRYTAGISGSVLSITDNGPCVPVMQGQYGNFRSGRPGIAVGNTYICASTDGVIWCFKTADLASGKEVWDLALPERPDIITLTYRENPVPVLLAGAAGRAYQIDPIKGEIMKVDTLLGAIGAETRAILGNGANSLTGYLGAGGFVWALPLSEPQPKPS